MPSNASIMNFTWLIGVALIVSGCEFDLSPGTTTTTAAPLPVSGGSALETIADAECTHDLSCDYVGPAGIYHDREECTEALRKTARDYMLAEPCPHGIDPAALSTCVVQIETQQCVESLEPLHRLSHCRHPMLCM